MVPESAKVHDRSESPPGSTRGRGSRRFSPWFLSLFFHVLMLGAMVLVVFPYSAKPMPGEPPLMTGEIVGSFEVLPAAPRSTTRATPRPSPVDALPAGPAISRPTPSRTPASTDVNNLRLITARPETSDFALPGTGSSAADMAEIGLDLGGGSSPEFFGVGRSARGAKKFVYVVDRSGSMHGSFDFVCDELRKSISGLRRSQKFHVIFFNDAAPLESPPRRLVNAVEANRREAFEFFGRVSPAGKTRPETGLARAFELEPDVIYLLTDGLDFPPDIHERLAEWNPKRATKIFVVGYLDRTGRPTLERIAREHHGEFRFVSEDDLP